MEASDIRWNESARTKILADADRVLREAVLDLGATMANRPWEDAFAGLNARLQGRFIDFKPGPDLRKYAEAIAAGEFSDAGEATGGQSGTPEVPTSPVSESPGASTPE